MAGTFYGIAHLNMKSQMREKVDGAYPARVAQELVYLSTPTTPATGVPASRDNVLLRAWRLVTRPATRKTAGCSTC